MDQMLPSPGFSIPSIGTPLHQPEEDQQILPNALVQQQQNNQPQMPALAPMGSGMTPTGLSSGMSALGNMGLPVLATPQKTMHTYVPGFATPQSLMQPQTPVSVHNTRGIPVFIVFTCSKILCPLWWRNPRANPQFRVWGRPPPAPWHPWRHIPRILESSRSYSKLAAFFFGPSRLILSFQEHRLNC